LDGCTSLLLIRNERGNVRHMTRRDRGAHRVHMSWCAWSEGQGDVFAHTRVSDSRKNDMLHRFALNPSHRSGG
jgi:hypothetical protein